jgi:hypothetical protein
LWLWNPKNHYWENTSLSLPQTCAEVSAAPKFDYPISHISWHLECTSITAGALRSTWECSCRVWEHFAQLQGGLGASRITWEHRWGLQECLGGLREASEPIYILLMYNATHRKNARHGKMAAARDLGNATHCIWCSVRGCEVPSELSGPSEIPRCSWRELGLLLMSVMNQTHSVDESGHLDNAKQIDSRLNCSQNDVARSRKPSKPIYIFMLPAHVTYNLQNLKCNMMPSGCQNQLSRMLIQSKCQLY